MKRLLVSVPLASVLVTSLALVPSSLPAHAAAPLITGTETDLGDAIPAKSGAIRSEDSDIGTLSDGRIVTAFASTGTAAGTARFFSVGTDGKTQAQITIPKGIYVLALSYNAARKSFFVTADDGFNGYLYEWSGGTTLTQRAQIAGGGKQLGLQSLGIAPNGDVYVGTYSPSNGRLYRWTASSATLTDLGQPVAGTSYVRSIAATTDAVYVGTFGTVGKLVKRSSTGSITAVNVPTAVASERSIEDIVIAGNYLMGRTADNFYLFGVDLRTNTPITFNDQVNRKFVSGGTNVETANPVTHLTGSSPYTVSPLIEGKYVYFQRAGAGLMRIDMTNGFKAVRLDRYWPGEMTTLWAGAMASNATSYAWLPNVLGRSAYSVVSGTVDGKLLANTSGQSAAATATVSAVGSPALVMSMGTGPDGSVYAGGFNLPAGVAKYTAGTKTVLPAPQIEGFGTFGSTVYMGGYNGSAVNSGPIYSYSGSGSPVLVKALNESQERPVALKQVGSMLAIGSMPVKNVFGGALSFYNPSTQALVVKRNLIPNQSIISLGAHNGLVVGGSSNTGGTGTTPSGSTMAQIFTYHHSTGALKTLTAPGPTSSTYRWVAAITPDPAVAGQFYAISTGQLIKFAVDSAGSISIVKNYGAYTGGTSSPSGREMGIVVSGKTLFVTMSDGIYAVNADTGERSLVAGTTADGKPQNLVSPDAGKTLFYARGTHWYRYTVASSGASGFLPFTGTRPAATGRIGEATGDTIADVWGIDADGELNFFSKSGTTWAAKGSRGIGLGYINAMTTVPDQNGDNRADLLYRDGRDGSLWYAYNEGNGYLRQGVKAGTGWAGMDQIIYAGHMVAGSSDQHVLARRRSDGALFRYKITPTGLTGATQVGSRWNIMKELFSVGDLYGDDAWDIVAVRTDGYMFGYDTSNNLMKLEGQIGRGWNYFSSIQSPGDLTNDGLPDMMAVRTDGTFWAFKNSGPGFTVMEQAGTGFGGYKVMA